MRHFPCQCRSRCTLAYNSLDGVQSVSSIVYQCIYVQCPRVQFKTQLDIFLESVEDLPCLPGFNNSLDGGDCRWWSPRDGQATN